MSSKILDNIFNHIANNTLLSHVHKEVAGQVPGTWICCKWNNGFFVCWGNFSVPTSVAVEDPDSPNSAGIHYSSSVSITLPLTTVGSSGIVGASVVFNNMLQWASNISISTNTLSFRIMRGSSLSTTTSPTVRVIVYGEYVASQDEHGGSGDGGGSGGGGGGGVSDYTQLTSKPRIENVELIGNKSFEDLNLFSLTEQEILSLIAEVSGGN